MLVDTNAVFKLYFFFLDDVIEGIRSKQYQLVKLPHGPLIKDVQLLDAVTSKLEDTYAKNKKSGKNDYVYLLSHILFHEDGTRFSGQPAKELKYRYYYSKTQKIRIHCDELDKEVISRIKKTMLDDETFKNMIEVAVSQRNAELPKLHDQILKR